MTGLSGLLDERIDQIAIEERKTFPVRMMLTIVVGSILVATAGLIVGAVWMAVIFASELCEQRLTRGIMPGHHGSARQRLLYTLIVFGISTAWVSAPVVWWSSGSKALEFVGILCLTAQMVHAQAFTFRSPLILSIAAGLPALALWVLTVLFGGFEGLELVFVSLTCGSAIGYILYSAYLNIVSTRLIEESRSEFRSLANTDPLTNLANRRMFSGALRDAVLKTAREGEPFALLLIDLDKFKVINDSVGHDAGDAVLVEAAMRLREAVGDRGDLARLGGDEFGILLPGPITVIEEVCGRIVEEFRRPIHFAGRPLCTSPSIGAAFCPHDAQTDEALFKCADLSLYDVKRAGGDGWARLTTGQGRRLGVVAVESVA